MNPIQEYLNEYLKVSKSTEDVDWNEFFKKFENLSKNSQSFFQTSFKFLKENQVADFHDAYIVGGIKPNMDDNSFNLTFRMLCYEKIDDASLKYPYQEIAPLYVSFTIDNKFRSDFQKLAVKCHSILSLVYQEQNLGLVYINQEGKTRHLYLEGIDLGSNQSVEPKTSKKLRM